CDYVGVDASASAVAIARERAAEAPCRFAIAAVPPLPPGGFDVVLLLETMLAFEDKDALVREVAAALRPGGRFAFTLEEGPPPTGCGSSGWTRGGSGSSRWWRSGSRTRRCASVASARGHADSGPPRPAQRVRRVGSARGERARGSEPRARAARRGRSRQERV